MISSVALIQRGWGQSDNIQCPQNRSHSDPSSCFLRELPTSEVGEARISSVPDSTSQALALLPRSETIRLQFSVRILKMQYKDKFRFQVYSQLLLNDSVGSEGRDGE